MVDPVAGLAGALDEDAAYARFRLFVVRGMIAAIAVFSAIFFAYLSRALWVEAPWVMGILQAHFAGIVSVPLAAIGALCVVLILRSTEGPIEFEGLGFKFSGAAGPVVLWALCFIVIVSGIRVLW
jgi:hypothetical protein